MPVGAHLCATAFRRASELARQLMGFAKSRRAQVRSYTNAAGIVV
jgi:hypothetical protein